MRALPLLLFMACTLPSQPDDTKDSVDDDTLVDSEILGDSAADTDVDTDDPPVDTVPEDSDLPVDSDAPGDTDDTVDPVDTDLGPLADPSQSGPWSTDGDSATLVRSPGPFGTSLEVSVTLPQGAGPFPVIVLLHGFQLEVADYISYAEHLGSWGYIVARPALPGSLIAPRSHLDLQGDIIALLDWLETENGPGDLLDGKADLETLGMMGHSLGGKITALVAANDDRVGAAVLLDPVDAAPPIPFLDPADYPSATPEQMGDITAPLAILGETTNGSGATACAPEDENFQEYYAHAVSPAVEVDVLGAAHMSFLSDPNCGIPCLLCPGATADPADTLDIATTITTAWFEIFLRGDARQRSWIDGPDMDVWVNGDAVETRSVNLP